MWDVIKAAGEIVVHPVIQHEDSEQLPGESFWWTALSVSFYAFMTEKCKSLKWTQSSQKLQWSNFYSFLAKTFESWFTGMSIIYRNYLLIAMNDN